MHRLLYLLVALLVAVAEAENPIQKFFMMMGPKQQREATTSTSTSSDAEAEGSSREMTCADPDALEHAMSLVKSSEAAKDKALDEKANVIKENKQLVRDLEVLRDDKAKADASFSAETKSLEQRIKQIQAEKEAQGKADESSKVDLEKAIEREVMVRMASELRAVQEEVTQKWRGDLRQAQEAHRQELEELRGAVQEEVAQKWRDDLQQEQEAHRQELEELRAKIVEAQNSVERLVNDARQQKDREFEVVRSEQQRVIEGLEQQIGAKDESLATLWKEKLETLEIVRRLEVEQRALRSEVEFWQDVFVQRSILNVTQLTGDTFGFIGGIREIAIAVVAPLGEKLGKLKRLNKIITKLSNLYDNHLRMSVEKAKSQTKIVLDTAKMGSRKAWHALLAHVAGHYSSVCFKALSFLKSLDGVSPGTISSIERSCQNPERSVRSILKLEAVLAVVFNSQLLLGLLVWILLLVPRKMQAFLRGRRIPKQLLSNGASTKRINSKKAKH